MKMYQHVVSFYYHLFDLPELILLKTISALPREELIEFLCWNDRNSVYRDEASMREFDNIMSKEEGIRIIMRQAADGEVWGEKYAEPIQISLNTR